NPGYGLAMVDGTTGAMQTFAVNSRVRNAGDNAAISSLAADANGVYGTGQHYGTGTLEGTFYANWSTGAIIWIEDCHGDTYSVYPAADVVYTTSHAHYCGNIGAFPQTNPWGYHRGLAFTKTVQGTITRDPLGYTNWQGTPRPALLHWFPDINTGTFTGLSQGGWSVAGNDQYILYGGEFTRVNNIQQQGIVRFAVPGTAPNKDAPRLSGASYVPTVSSPSNNTVRVTWPANWDRDNTRLTYQVILDGATATPRYTTTFNSNFWTLPSTTFTDTNVPSGTHRYRIRVVDPFGNVAIGNDVNVTVGGVANPGPVDPPPVAGAYAEDVVGDSPVSYWRLGETGGSTSAADSVGSSTATASGGVTFGSAGAIGSDSNTAATFDGSDDLVATRSAIQGPNSFAVEAWFKTTATGGGKIVGFGNASSGLSTKVDRHLYLDTAGRVVFGAYPNAKRTIQSAAALNNGQWHHVVANLGPSGMELYVDGVRVAQRTDTTSGQSYTGYWRIGGDLSWAGANYFPGAIDEVAVYPAPLSAQQVSSHYAASGR
ncbi:MAG: LamG domain-containing protein, partial [Mycetocola sp.]